jgi:hypothetical protein
MSKKLKFPVAKIRGDGTPAIWLTSTYWMILESGLRRDYCDRRKTIGNYRARCEARKALGDNWKSHPHLKAWEHLDSWPLYQSFTDSAFELYSVDCQAWESLTSCTPDKLKELGDKWEKSGYDEEVKLLEATKL